MDDDDLILCITPSLVAILLHAEREKGSPLTEAEVLEMRDKAPCIALPRDEAMAVAEARGYDDIDAENCWEEWQEARIELMPKD